MTGLERPRLRERQIPSPSRPPEGKPSLGKLNVFRITKAGVTSLDMPDILKIARAKLGVDPSTFSASGQLPSRWIQARALEVTVRMRSPRGKHSTIVILDLHDDGSISGGCNASSGCPVRQPWISCPQASAKSMRVLVLPTTAGLRHSCCGQRLPPFFLMPGCLMPPGCSGTGGIPEEKK